MSESAAASKKQFAIQKLYLKDASFESPESPQSFGFTQWEPQVELNLTNTHQHLEGDHFEAVLCATATVKVNDKTAFLIEVHFAGIFVISGFDETELKYLIGSQAMTALFPYVREAVTDLTTRGGFPPLILSPVNFDALYQKHLKEQQQAQNGGDAAQ